MDCQMFFINFCRCKDKFQKLLVFPIHHSICLVRNEITSQFCYNVSDRNEASEL